MKIAMLALVGSSMLQSAMAMDTLERLLNDLNVSSLTKTSSSTGSRVYGPQSPKPSSQRQSYAGQTPKTSPLSSRNQARVDSFLHGLRNRVHNSPKAMPASAPKYVLTQKQIDDFKNALAAHTKKSIEELTDKMIQQMLLGFQKQNEANRSHQMRMVKEHEDRVTEFKGKMESALQRAKALENVGRNRNKAYQQQIKNAQKDDTQRAAGDALAKSLLHREIEGLENTIGVLENEKRQAQRDLRAQEAEANNQVVSAILSLSNQYIAHKMGSWKSITGKEGRLDKEAQKFANMLQQTGLGRLYCRGPLGEQELTPDYLKANYKARQ